MSSFVQLSLEWNKFFMQKYLKRKLFIYTGKKYKNIKQLNVRKEKKLSYFGFKKIINYFSQELLGHIK